MTERAHLDSGSHITQSIDAVKSLLAYVGRASDPLPTFLELPERQCILVLSNKKDAYYTVTPKACSCPSATYRPGQSCKHQRKYFGVNLEQVAKTAKVSESIKPNLPAFRPFDTMPREETAAKASPLFAIDCHDTTTRDVAYHEMQMVRDLWPVEA